MDHRASIFFRSIPAFVALFCLLYGGYITLSAGTDSQWIAGPVVFFCGFISLIVLGTTATLIRQILHIKNRFFRITVPAMGSFLALITFIAGIFLMSLSPREDFSIAGHALCGMGLMGGCVATLTFASRRFALIAQNSEVNDYTPNPRGFSLQQELRMEAVAAFLCVIAWAWTILLWNRDAQSADRISAACTGGAAWACTTLTILILTIVRQTRNTYTRRERRKWFRLALATGYVPTIWGLIMVLFYSGPANTIGGCILMGWGWVCLSIASGVVLIARSWKSYYPLTTQQPFIPVLMALGALLLGIFLFEQTAFEDYFFIPSRIMVGLGALCFTFFPIVSILSIGTRQIQ